MAESETGDPRIVTRPERNAATSFRDNAGGPPSKAETYQGRPQDLEQGGWQGVDGNSTFASRKAGDPGKPKGTPGHSSNTTLAQRAAAAKKAVTKQQKADDAEDKAVSSAGTKRTTKQARRS